MNSCSIATIVGLFLSAPAFGQNVVSYIGTVNAVPTNSTHTINLPGFDSTFGELTQVMLSFSGGIWQSVAAENLEAVARQFTFSSNATVTLSKANAQQLFSIPGALQQTGTLGAFDGQLDFVGSSGLTFSQRTQGGGWLIDPNHGAYITHEAAMLPFTVAAIGASSVTLGGNFASTSSTNASLSLTIEYTYTPIPEPGHLALLLGVGVVGVILGRRLMNSGDLDPGAA